MYKVINITSAKEYESQKAVLRFESVPNTAVGFDCCRKYIIDTRFGHKYFLSAINEKDYFLQNEKDGWSVWFSVDGNDVIITRAWNYRTQREERADRYMKKYALVCVMAHSCIKYDGLVKYTRYPVYSAS